MLTVLVEFVYVDLLFTVVISGPFLSIDASCSCCNSGGVDLRSSSECVFTCVDC